MTREEEIKQIWTPKNMKNIGLLEWEKPDDPNVVYYFFNAKYFSKMGQGNDIILSEEEDKILINCIIILTQNTFKLVNKSKEDLDTSRASNGVKKYVRNKLMKEAGLV